MKAGAEGWERLGAPASPAHPLPVSESCSVQAERPDTICWLGFASLHPWGLPGERRRYSQGLSLYPPSPEPRPGLHGPAENDDPIGGGVHGCLRMPGRGCGHLAFCSPGALPKVWGWVGVSPMERRCSHDLAPAPVPLPQAADTSGPVPRWERSAQGCDGHIARHHLDRPPGLAPATKGCITSMLQSVSPSFWPPRDHLSSLVLCPLFPALGQH